MSATILVTATLFLVLHRIRHSRPSATLVVAGGCWLVVLVFVAATVPKVFHGGWAPVGTGLVLVVAMSTWRSGQRRLQLARDAVETTPEEILEDLTRAPDPARRVAGSAVFLTPDHRVAPVSLRTVVEAGYGLAERVVLLSWHVADKPSASPTRTVVEVETYGDRYDGILAVTVTLGYRERLNVHHVLAAACEQEPEALRGVDPEEAWYFVSDPIPRLARSHDGMAVWRQRVFLVIDRLATDRVEQLSLPAARTIVIGREFDL